MSSHRAVPMRSTLQGRQAAIIAQAERDGFLIEGRVSRTNGSVAGRAWSRRCFENRRPCLIVSQGRNLASVVLTLDIDHQLTEYGMRLIAEFLEPLSRKPDGRGSWPAGIDEYEVLVFVPWEHARAVARALLAIVAL